MTHSDSNKAASHERWWGEFEIEAGGSAYWRIGPLELVFERSEREWRVTTRHGDDQLDSKVETFVRQNARLEGEGVEVSRFAFREAGPLLRLTPAMANRHIIVSPEVTLSIPPREEATIYASSPLWVEVGLGSPIERVASEPVLRPSDTWFGPSTMEGEFCYASRSRARLELPGTELLPHRAVTAITLRNRAPSALNVERVKLPAPNLSLFADTSGRLWTENVTLDREEDGDFAALRLGRGPGKGIDAEWVRGPHERPERGLSIRVFGRLFQ